MKRVLFFVLSALLFQFSFAQWTTSGSDIYNSNSGNVGIGTLSPGAKLDVKGTAGSVQLLVQPSSAGHGIAKIASNGNGHAHLDIDAVYASYIDFLSGGTSKWQIGRPLGTYDFAVYNSNLSNTPFLIQSTTGNVGIGTTSPEEKLHINGNSRFNGSGWFSRNNNGSAAVALRLGQNQGWDYPVIEISTSDNGGSSFSSWYSTRWADYLDFSRASSSGTKNIFEIGGSDGEQYVSVYSVDGSTQKIRFSADGTSYIQNSVAIGTTNAQGYKLAVNGDAIFTKVKVKTYATWPDYVFHSFYKLRPLKDLENYIKQNNHLPDVPSANEVEKNGLDLGDNQAELLKKIEELTLYIIEQDKKIDSQQKQITELLELKKDLETIKSKLKTN